MTNEGRSSYRQIVKATSIFGSVQVYQILVSLVRSKLVAVLLGAHGMGISGLLVSTTTLIGSVTNLGLGVSAVRNISDAHVSGDSHRMALVAAVLRRLVWITGLVGLIIMVVLAPWISLLTFGNEDYVLALRVLSVTLLITTISSSQYVLLQGMRKLKELAKANAAGATVGLVGSIPLYYYFGMAGIVPALVFTSLAGLALAIFFGRKASLGSVVVSWRDVRTEGRDMVRTGTMLSLSGLVGASVSYLSNIFIARAGNVSDVGMYTAGFAMVNTYVGMFFNAMGTDYYPRLSAAARDLAKATQLVNQQAEMTLLILGPLLAVFILALEHIIIVIYSSDFVTIVPMVQWVVLAVYLKAMVWVMGYLIIARNETKVFFLNELVVNVYSLLLALVGYTYYGLEGLGVSFFVAYIFAFIQNVILLYYRIGFRFESSSIKIAIVIFILLVLLTYSIRVTDGWMLNLISCLCISSVFSVSFIVINRRIGVIKTIKEFLR